MRKTPIILSAIALMALCLITSCAHHKMMPDDIPIVIDVTASGSKALIEDPVDTVRLYKMISECYDNIGNPNVNAGFGVFGYKLAQNGSNTKLFDNMRVYPEPSARPAPTVAVTQVPWVYTPSRYWDPMGSYQFIAYWPYNQNVYSTFDTGTRSMTVHITNVPNWQEVNNTEKDYMTARRIGTRRYDFASGIVNLSFEHLLAQLEIRAYYVGAFKEKDGGVKMKAIMLSESQPGLGDVLSGTDGSDDNESSEFIQSSEDAHASVVTSSVDTATNFLLMRNDAGILIPYKDELTGRFTIFSSAANDTVESSEGSVLIGRWLMIPRKWKGINISATYNYKVGDEMTDINPLVDLANAPKTPTTIGEDNFGYKTQPGKKYIITLMIDTSSGGISVKQIAVQDWTEHDVSRIYYNW